MLEIHTLEVTPFQQNARVIACTGTNEAVVVDPGGDVREILKILTDHSLRCVEIWLTHAHLDHCGGVSELIELTGAKLVGHPIERELRANVLKIASLYGLPQSGMRDCPEPDKYIVGGEELTVGKERFSVLFTPGHSPGHVVFYNAKGGVLIAGDTVFAGSIGRTDLPGGDHAALMRSISEKILVLPDDTKVLPGHGPDTTVAKERKHNPFIAGGFT